MRTAEVAEEAGLDAVWLAEHHFVPYGTCPSAVTLAALLLGRTSRIRVGTAVSELPTVHPVALGEQAALLHVTSWVAVSRWAWGAAGLGWTWRAPARAWRHTRRGSRNHSIPAGALAARAVRGRAGRAVPGSWSCPSCPGRRSR